jgi:hypothetical protein
MLLVYTFFFFFGGTGVWTQGFVLAKQVLEKQVLYYLSHISSLFCSGYLGDGFSQTICLGWPWTTILPISASQVIRITGMSYWCSAIYILFIIILECTPTYRNVYCKTVCHDTLVAASCISCLLGCVKKSHTVIDLCLLSFTQTHSMMSHRNA